jgi:signal transduction histidine kinase
MARSQVSVTGKGGPFRPRSGLAARLFVAQTLVVALGAATAGLVAIAVGPAIFTTHLHQAVGHGTAEAYAGHVEEAYASAGAISLTVALACALTAALAVSAFVARRVARPIEQLARAAAEVTEGRYDVRIVPTGIAAEFDTVVVAFNAMSARLAEVEATRRRLLADLGHELRTPIATIEAYVEAAEDGITVGDEDPPTVLRAQTGRLRRLAEDIAAVSSAEEHQLDLHPRQVDPAELVRSALAAARPRYAAKGVELSDRIAAGLPAVSADPDRLGQVLGNLLTNALRHTPAGGAVTLTADQPTRGQLRLSVADTGEGIPAEHLPHVFERFYRADTARDRRDAGSGIGLAIARAIVTEHGGRIAAASDGPGTGATVTVTLPAPARTRL